MQKEELKALVKKYFNLTEINNSPKNNEEVKAETFTEAKLADGTVITNMVDADFEVGQELHVITAEGEHVLAPSGEHTTESGIVITVDGEGIITGVKHPDQEGEGSLEPSEEEMSAESVEEKVEMAYDEEDVMAEHGDEEEAMEEHDIKEAIVEAIAEVVMPQIEEMKVKLGELEEKMNDTFASIPATTPTNEAKFSKQSNDSLDFLNKKFDFKKAQLDSILSRTNK